MIAVQLFYVAKCYLRKPRAAVCKRMVALGGGVIKFRQLADDYFIPHLSFHTTSLLDTPWFLFIVLLVTVSNVLQCVRFFVVILCTSWSASSKCIYCG